MINNVDFDPWPSYNQITGISFPRYSTQKIYLRYRNRIWDIGEHDQYK